MKRTKNKYSFPLDISPKVIISYDKSPAHINLLKNAVDFIVEENTPVKAAADGIVVDIKIDSNLGGKEEKYDTLGNYIEIQHDNKEYSIYEHLRLNGALVKIGDRVKEGQVIGYSGATGWIANLGPHLHFDVHKYFGNDENEYETLKITWKDKKWV